MAQPHAACGTLIDIAPLGPALREHVTTAFFKSAQLELVRLVMPQGRELREHHVAGEITLLCIEGRIEFTAQGRSQTMTPGQLIHLAGGEPHALRALADATALLTICVAGAG